MSRSIRLAVLLPIFLCVMGGTAWAQIQSAPDSFAEAAVVAYDPGQRARASQREAAAWQPVPAMPGSTVRSSPMADWSVNSWGSPATRYAVETVTARDAPTPSGHLVRRFTIISRGNGDAHFFGSFSARFGNEYRLRILARAPSGHASVTFGLRKDKPYYEFIAARTVTLDRNWREITISGRYPFDEAAASARILIDEAGTSVELLDASIEQRAPSPIPYSNLSRTVPSTFFGMTVNKLGVHRHWPGMKTRVIRLWDTATRWMDIEPQRGQWDFKRTDLYVDYARQNGADILFTLGQTPRWAASDAFAKCDYGAGCSPPRDLDLWRAYVRKLVARYGDQVRYWELWNEPDYKGFWQGTPELLATMARISEEEIHAVHPEAVLLGPAVTTTGVRFLDRFLAHPDSRVLDGLTVHYYIKGEVDSLPRVLDNFRTVAASHGFPDRPFWVTEFGVACRTRPGSCPARGETGSAPILWTARALFLMAATGVDSVSFYNWERRIPHSPLVLSKPDYRTPTGDGLVYEEAARLLSGAVVSESFEMDGVIVVRFRSEDGHWRVALWSDRGAKPFRVGSNWPYRDYRLLLGKVPVPFTNGVLDLPAEDIVIGSD